jgi:hypothetical protein
VTEIALDAVDVRARITLDSDLERPRWGDYRPNHNLGDGTGLYFGRILIDENNPLLPGRPQDLTVNFWLRRGMAIGLKPGTQWVIQEGLKRVGTGSIIEVLLVEAMN